MNTLTIIILTLMVYSLIAVIIYFITGEKDDVLEIFGMGIVGWILLFIFDFILKPIHKFFKYYNKRSIFEDENGNRFYCKVKYADDFCWHYDAWHNSVYTGN